MEHFSWSAKVRLLEKRRWLICLPLAFAFLFAHFHRFAVGVVSDAIMRDFSLAMASELGLLSSVYFYTYAAMQIPAGIMADFWGPRRTVTASLLIAAGGAAVFGWAPSLGWLYAGRFLIGLGVAFIYISIVKIFAEWFRSREFGTMSGLSAAVGNLGFMLASVPFALLVEFTGWRESFYIAGVLAVAVAAYCWLAVRDTPAELGLPSVEEIAAAEGAAAAGPAENAGVAQSLRMVVANVYTWPPFVASTAAYSVFATFAGVYGVSYFMQVYGMSRVEASNYLMMLPLGYMLMGPAAGFLSDRLASRRVPYIALMVFTLLTWLGFTLWNGGKPPVWALYPLCFALGAGFASVALTLACAKEVNPPQMTGIAAGLVNAGPFIGAALVQPLFGLILDLNWQGVTVDGLKLYPQEAFASAFWLCVALLALSVGAAALVKETRCVNIAGELFDKTRRQ